MAFRVGMKVICIDDQWTRDDWRKITNTPVAGGVYTIRRVYTGPRGPAFHLEEILNEPGVWRNEDGSKGEAGFYARRFRPLIDRKTDTGMAILKKLLNSNSRQKFSENVS